VAPGRLKYRTRFLEKISPINPPHIEPNHRPTKEEVLMSMTTQPAIFKDKYFHSHLKIKLMAKKTRTKEIKKEGKPKPWNRRPER
jgi:hypothetical protein